MKMSCIRRVLSATLVLVMCLTTVTSTGISAVLSADAAASVSVSIERRALELSLGETDTLVPTVEGGEGKVSFRSSDPAVVSVDDAGNLKANKLGQATVTVSVEGSDEEAVCSVTVVESEHTFKDEIMITIFWPPTPNYLNDEQFQLLADAGITQVIGAGEESLHNKECQDKMLELSAKYGMGLTIWDGSNWNYQDEATIAEMIKRYHNVPGATGFYLADEPMNPNWFVSTYVGIKKLEPNAYVHLNFLPSGPYGYRAIFEAQLNDYARLADHAGYPIDYLMFDSYPFGPGKGSMWRDGFYADVRSVHDIALKNGVGSGLYIQTVSIPGSFRRPEAEAIRYEMYMALAFGYKQLSFFTWFTPTHRGEPFSDGIISPEGVPNEHYYAIKEINSEIHVLSPILAKCDALEVYFTGEPAKAYNQPVVPEDFFVQCGNDTDASLAIFSFLRHRETGRNYLMVVNNNFTKEKDIELEFIDEITSIAEVSRVDASLIPIELVDGKATITLAAGDAMLIALPEGFDHYKAPEGQPPACTNLALDAVIDASSSMGQDGCYIYPLNDGSTCTPGIVGEFIWRSVDATDAYVQLDLGRTLAFNRVDLYPTGNLLTFGQNFPVNVEISVSNDADSWTTVKTLTGITIEEVKAYMINFDEQKARYIRLDFKDIPEGQPWVSLNEIEVYCDDGTVPAPKMLNMSIFWDKIIEYKDGANLVKRKATFTSTHPDSGLPYGGVDFGDVFAVDKIILIPDTLFPSAYTVELSLDGLHWTTVADVKDAPVENGGENVEIRLDTPVTAHYMRVTATEPRTGEGDMFKLDKTVAYGKPVCDKTELTAALATYEAEGGDMSADLAKNADSAVQNALLTQTQADDLTKQLYLSVGYNANGTNPNPKPTEPETEPETEPVTEPVTEPLPEGDAPAETTVVVTESETAAQAGGCKSTVMTAGALILLAAGALVLRRRREV